VEDSVVVAESYTTKQLMHEGFDGDGIEHAALASGVHVFLQVFVHEFEDQHEFVLSVDDIVKTDYVFVLKFLHKRNLTDRGAGSALFRVEVDLFESDELACLAVAALEDLRVVGQRWLRSRASEERRTVA
jgi:hypothetical protein